jgi:hypothetical protein
LLENGDYSRLHCTMRKIFATAISVTFLSPGSAMSRS